MESVSTGGDDAPGRDEPGHDEPVPTVPAPVPAEHGERHATWLELFFDLVAVAGIGMLAHLLESDATAAGLLIYVVAFAAYWLVWACFTTYGNLAADETRTLPMLLGMAVLGVMTAAVPEIHADHARTFAIAYVVGRFVAARPWQGAQVVVDLPVVQTAVGVVPWIVSWWVDGTARYVLWGVGLALDLLLLLSTSRERLLADSQQRLDRVVDRFARRAPDAPHHHRGPGRDVPTSVVAVDADTPHLGERLGLFVLIVLGEGLVQVIDAVSDASWDRRLWLTAAGAFVLMVALWAVAVQRGYAGVALLTERGLQPRLSWAAHLVSTGALATLAAVLGTLVADPSSSVDAHDRVLLVVAFAAYGLLAAAIHLTLGLHAPDHAARRAGLARATWIGAPVIVASAVVGLGADLDAEADVWVLAAAIVVVLARQVAATTPRPERRSRPERA